MADAPPTRRLAAILAADVAGYSRLMEADEDGTLARLKALRREAIEPAIADHRGRLVKLTGDGALVAFDSAVDAVRCAVASQQAVAAHEEAEPAERRIAFRIGINLGDIILDEDDVYGDGVNLAARLEGLAEPGGVVVSANVHDEVARRLQYAFEDMGERHVKNISRPVRAWRLRFGAAEAAPEPAGAPAARAERPGIAVLPFANMSGDAEQDYFCDGMVEEIITGLSRVRWLTVIARNSTFAYKGQTPDIRKVGRELAVGYVVEGSVRKAGDRVRITAQLIEAEAGGHLWADRFDGSLADVFDLQDRITAGVVAAIEPSLREAEIERARRKRPDSLEAYDLYLRALPHAYAYTLEGWTRAIDLLDRALAREPDYAEAHGLAAWCHWHCFIDEGRVESREPSIAHARAVLALPGAEAAPLAHAALALAHHREHRKTALGMIDRALARNPSSMQAHAFGAVVNVFEARWKRAAALAETALRLNPFDPNRFNALAALGISRFFLDDPAGAETALREALHLNPRHQPSQLFLTAVLASLGRGDEARGAAAELLRLHPDFRIGRYRERQPLPDEVFDVLAASLRAAGLPE